MNEPTPGPWIVSGRHVPVTLNDSPDKQVLFDSVEAVGYEAGGGIALVHRKPGHGNPNASLIAAAPDLLAVVESLVALRDTMDGRLLVDENSPLIDAARAALAKLAA